MQHCDGKSSVQKEEVSLQQQILDKFKEETCEGLHLEQRFFFCAETCTLRKGDLKNLESLKCGAAEG
jgi:hypothetical protein